MLYCDTKQEGLNTRVLIIHRVHGCICMSACTKLYSYTYKQNEQTRYASDGATQGIWMHAITSSRSTHSYGIKYQAWNNNDMRCYFLSFIYHGERIPISTCAAHVRWSLVWLYTVRAQCTQRCIRVGAALHNEAREGYTTPHSADSQKPKAHRLRACM